MSRWRGGVYEAEVNEATLNVTLLPNIELEAGIKLLGRVNNMDVSISIPSAKTKTPPYI